jgi:hypothetical protein
MGADGRGAALAVEYLVVRFGKARGIPPVIVLLHRNHSLVEGLRTKNNSVYIRHSPGSTLIGLRYCIGGEGSDPDWS